MVVTYILSYKLCFLISVPLLRSAMAGRLYKLQSKHTSNSGFYQTIMPSSGYTLFTAEQRAGYLYRGLTFSTKLTVREICRATYSARQARLRI